MGNAVTWFEVVGNDTEALGSFYGELFDWKLEPMAEMPYTIADPGADNGLRGGIGPDPNGGPGHVTFYVDTDDVEGSLARAEELGGRRVAGPIEIPPAWIGLFSDPEGHVVGLIQQK